MNRYRAMIDANPPLSVDEERDLLKAWFEHRDERARSKLLARHIRLVFHVASKYRHYGADFDDLIGAGNEGLVYALRKFEPERGLRFRTYAEDWIRSRMQKFVLSTISIACGGIRSTDFAFFRKRMRELEHVVGFDEATNRIAAELGQDLASVRRRVIRACAGHDNSLDVRVGEDGGISRGDMLPFEGDGPDREAERNEFRRVVKAAIVEAYEQLSPRERQVAVRRLAQHPDDADTLEQLGASWGVTRERGRQLTNRTKAKLRKSLAVFEEQVA